MIIIEAEYKPVCMVECVDWVGRVDWHRCWVDGGGGRGKLGERYPQIRGIHAVLTSPVPTNASALANVSCLFDTGNRNAERELGWDGRTSEVSGGKYKVNTAAVTHAREEGMVAFKCVRAFARIGWQDTYLERRDLCGVPF